MAGALIFWMFVLPVPHIPTLDEVMVMGPLIPLIIITLLIGGVLDLGAERRRKYLVANGIKIIGTIKKYDTIDVRGAPERTYKRLCAEAEFQGEKRVFKSDILLESWKDTLVPAGTSIDIYLDPENTKKYFVDVRLFQK